MRSKTLLISLGFAFVVRGDEVDPFLWLEQVQEKEALTWVQEQNQRSLDLLENRQVFKRTYDETLNVLNNPDKIPDVSIRDGYIYNLYTDAEHIRGLYRRMKIEDYKNKSKNWETVLDIDALGRAENESWVYGGMNCHKKSSDHCIVSLSRGGKDANVKREFSLVKKEFKKNGFFISESKTNVVWHDENTLLVDYDLEENARTTSGYPRTVKIWKRGEDLKKVAATYEGQVTDVSVYSMSIEVNNKKYVVVGRAIDFYTSESFVVDESGKLLPIPIPLDSEGGGVMDGELFFKLGSDWNKYVAGSVVSVDLRSVLGKQKPRYSLVIAPTEKRVIERFNISKDAIYVGVLDNVRGKILRLTRGQKNWDVYQVNLPEEGHSELDFVAETESEVIVRYGSYLTPTTLYLAGKSKVQVLRQLPPLFDSNDLVEEQLWATSKDGTKIPYTIVHAKNYKLNGSNPTLLYGYGGFKISLTPYYNPVVGKAWLERGGVYVVANIRGGGEFGPAWHLAALKEKRQVAYDDFIAVGEDLVKRQITGPKYIAIEGGSNGGLLVGTVAMQRPDLFKAVICKVPLLDMIRYTQLPPGASWIGEYGDPADEKMRKVIEKYSPYQNIRQDVKYPYIFFQTSTRDDRVHPGHARKMTAKMLSAGQDVYLYENVEGGHGGSADNIQQAKMTALSFTFLEYFLGRD
ncbi:MAG: hypothetical protein A4S09_04470 [Proteobacteria bacterium SG_bin7]|nr:MAG: hypothetical protein A4S09_04470 [Proteobacteria bacterium SG_bin7]